MLAVCFKRGKTILADMVIYEKDKSSERALFTLIHTSVRNHTVAGKKMSEEPW